MTWFKVDDSFYDHPKWRSIDARIKPHAVMAWVFAGAYSARHLTNGRVSKQQVRALLACSKKAADRAIDALCVAGLWSEDAASIQFRNWERYQPTKQAIENERERARERRAASRARHAGTTPGHPASVPAVSQRPDPTRPDQLQTGRGEDPRLPAGSPASVPGPKPLPPPVFELEPEPPVQFDMHRRVAWKFAKAFRDSVKTHFRVDPTNATSSTIEAENAAHSIISTCAMRNRDPLEIAAKVAETWVSEYAQRPKVRARGADASPPKLAWCVEAMTDLLSRVEERLPMPDSPAGTGARIVPTGVLGPDMAAHIETRSEWQREAKETKSQKTAGK